MDPRSPVNSRRSRVTALAIVRHLAPLFVALASIACTSAPRSAVEETRVRFSEEHYCPIRRVAVAVVDTTPPAPPAIASDPERLAMWRRAAARERQAPDARGGVELRVRGCDEQAVYRCSSIAIAAHRYRRSVRYERTAVCLEEPAP